MFTLYKEKIKIAKNAYIPPSLLKLKKLVDEETYMQWAMYIFLNADRTDDNPIKDIPKPQVASMAARLAFDNNLPKANIELAVEAIKEYKEHFFDKTQADIDLYDNKMVEFMTLLKNTTPKIVKNVHEQTGKVSYTTNIDIITAILDNVIKIIIDKATMVGLQKSGNSVVMLRGGISPNSKGKLTKIT